MGNAQSAEEPSRRSRAAQKLSKPKTGNPATAGLLSPSSFSYSSRRPSNVQLPYPPAPSPTVVATSRTSYAVEGSAALGQHVDSTTSLPRESRRRSLFRSGSSSRAATDSPQRHHSTGPGSRTNSLTYESAIAQYGQPGSDGRLVQSESSTSWNYNPGSYESKRLLNLTEEPGLEQATLMSENDVTRVSEPAWKGSSPSHPPSAPITRASSDVSLYMPVRRRSIIQTPGVATRSSSTRNLPPLPQPNFRHSHPSTPNLSRRPSVESYRSGIVSMPPRIEDPELMPRVLTPCEERYQSTGAYKLGTLRITNGSPSPLTPDIERRFGNESPTRPGGVARDGYFSEAVPREATTTTAGRTGKAKSLSVTAHNLPASPAPSQPMSPALQTTSKVTALEDQLFDDDAQPEYSSVEILEVRLDPNAKPPAPQDGRDAGNSITRTDSGFVSTSSPLFETPHKPLTKADSGYSSNVSLRSFHGKTQSHDKQLAPASSEKEQPQSPGYSRVPAALEEQDWAYPQMPGEEVPPPPVPPKDSARSLPRLGPVTRKSISVPGAAEESRGRTPSRTERQLPKPALSIPSIGGGPLSPGSTLQSPRSVRSSVSDNSSSALSIGSGPQKTRRLQRLLSGTRRSAAGPPAVHVTRALEQRSIPPVPRDVERSLLEHAGRYPTAAKRLALKPRASLDTLKTIFSVGSIEASLDAVNSMQTAPAGPELPAKEGLWKQTLQLPASIANAAATIIPRKPISRKPVPAREESGKTEEKKLKKDRDSDGRHSVPMSPADSDASSPYLKSRGRTMSLTILAERGVKAIRPLSDRGFSRSVTDLPSPTLPSPVAKAMSAKTDSRTSTVANTTRRPPSLRVPPPLRPQSSVPALSRRPSRESIQSYPAARTRTLTSRMSMESIHSQSPSQPAAGRHSLQMSSSSGGISMDPRRLQSFRQYHSSQFSPYRSASMNRDGQAEHGTAARRNSTQTFTPGADSRRNSITSVQSEGVYIQRTGSAQGWQQARTAQQPQPHSLRHRASYDGSGSSYYHPHHYTQQQRLPQKGFPPSMSNGYTAPAPTTASRRVTYHEPPGGSKSDLAATWNRSQVDAAAGQWYQHGRLISTSSWSSTVVGAPSQGHVQGHQQGPGHYRNRSAGSYGSGGYGPNPPYRVLHSYNSPAYRNAPIWG